MFPQPQFHHPQQQLQPPPPPMNGGGGGGGVPERPKRRRERACVPCKRDHAGCDRGSPCGRCCNLGRAAECRSTLPYLTPTTEFPPATTAKSSSISATTAPQPAKRQKKVAPIIPATGPIPVVVPPAAAAAPFVRPLPLASFLASSAVVHSTSQPAQPQRPSWSAAPEWEREGERAQWRERYQHHHHHSQGSEREPTNNNHSQDFNVEARHQEQDRRLFDLASRLFDEVNLLKRSTKQLHKESQVMRKRITSLREREESLSPPPPSTSTSSATTTTSSTPIYSTQRPLVPFTSSTAAFIPYSDPAQTRTAPPVLCSIFPPMSEAHVAFVVDDDNKPFCLIKRQPLADDRVAIMHSMNAAWTKVLYYKAEELMGQTIRKVVEDASLRESRNRINAFHAQQAAAVSKGRSCSPCLHLQPRFIRKDGTCFEALVRQQFLYDAFTREPLWSFLCIDGIREIERKLYPCTPAPTPSSSTSTAFSTASTSTPTSRSSSSTTAPPPIVVELEQQQQQQQQPLSGTPLSPATLELLNNIRSWS